jgi:Helix-turn-helix domain
METKQMTAYVTQAEKVINYLSKGNTLTSKQARARFKIQNLRARIHELKAEGYNIGTTPVTFKDTGAEGVAYSLVTKKARKSSKKA